jgi:hypothetical protein
MARALEEFEAAHRARPDEFQALTLATGSAEALGDHARAYDIAARALKLALAEARPIPKTAARSIWRLDCRFDLATRKAADATSKRH